MTAREARNVVRTSYQDDAAVGRSPLYTDHTRTPDVLMCKRMSQQRPESLVVCSSVSAQSVQLAGSHV